MSRGIRSQLQHLDNEASQAVVDHLKDEHVDFQLAPPSLHCMYAAERAIHTLKNYLIAILCVTYPNFNLALWDILIPQVLITLNIIHKSNMSPNISTYSQIHGAYDFNHTPTIPPGMRLMVYENPDDRKHEHIIQSRSGIYAHQCTTIDATKCVSMLQELK